MLYIHLIVRHIDYQTHANEGRLTMYKDFFPPLEGGITPPATAVVVMQHDERVRPEAVIAACHRHGALSRQSEGLCFWIVFEDNPRRARPFTEEGLRSSVDEEGYISASCDPENTSDRGEELPSYANNVNRSAG
jgi:hypothetical protein